VGVSWPGEVGDRDVFGLRNDPNPFPRVTTIRFAIPPGASGSAEPVRLVVYDVRGEEVALLANGALAAGAHERQLDGSRLSSGVYYSRLQVGGVCETRKMIRIE
jgi:hypothetical protein